MNSIVKKRTDLHKLVFTDQALIEEFGFTHVWITAYPSIQFYTEWLDAGMANRGDDLDRLARQILKTETGEQLMPTDDDVIEYDVYEHIILLITQYLLKSKTKRLTQPDLQGGVNT
jgi:hypothetical protein